MDEDEHMQEADDQPRSEVIKFGDAKLATTDAKAAGVAQGNINVHNAETLDLPEVQGLIGEKALTPFLTRCALPSGIEHCSKTSGSGFEELLMLNASYSLSF